MVQTALGRPRYEQNMYLLFFFRPENPAEVRSRPDHWTPRHERHHLGSDAKPEQPSPSRGIWRPRFRPSILIYEEGPFIVGC